MQWMSRLQYALKVNLNNVPIVAGTLLDLDVNADFIKGIILGAGNYCPAEPLIQELEKRNQLKLILPWLESRVNEGSQDVMVHSAIAKVYVDTNNNPEHFLKSNEYYDPRTVGIYCEKRDPQLCVVAFTRGQCDDELIDVTTRYQLFRAQVTFAPMPCGDETHRSPNHLPWDVSLSLVDAAISRRREDFTLSVLFLWSSSRFVVPPLLLLLPFSLRRPTWSTVPRSPSGPRS